MGSKIMARDWTRQIFRRGDDGESSYHAKSYAESAINGADWHDLGCQDREPGIVYATTAHTKPRSHVEKASTS